MVRKLLVLLFCLSLLCVTAEAHSGGTDAAGGHIDHFTGEYHYHHGYPAHQHPDGVCPYAKSAERESAAQPSVVAKIGGTIGKVSFWAIFAGVFLFYAALFVWAPLQSLRDKIVENEGGRVNYMEDKKVRFVMFIISATLAVVAAAASHFVLDFPLFASVVCAVLICIPATWQLFFMPVAMRLKQYCMSIGLYLVFWGAPVWFYLSQFCKSSVAGALGWPLLIGIFVFWGLGAFLKDRR